MQARQVEFGVLNTMSHLSTALATDLTAPMIFVLMGKNTSYFYLQQNHTVLVDRRGGEQSRLALTAHPVSQTTFMHTNFTLSLFLLIVN